MFIGFLVLIVISLASAKPYNPKLDSTLASESRPKHVTKSRREPYVRWQHEPASNLILIAGQKHVIECEAAGSPPPKIHWLKNGRRIDQNQAIFGNSEIVDTSENPEYGLSLTKAKLDLGCVRPEDSGHYTCVAENLHDKIAAESQIKVLASIESSPPYRTYSECSLHDSKKPSITMWTHTILDRLDFPVILHCRPDSRTSTVKWINADGRELNAFTTDGKYDILSNGDLLIRKVSWDDMGSYFCVAENQYGQDKTESFLYPAMNDKQ